MNTIINHKRYTVSYVFNMVGNYYFTDKNGTNYLVDAEDVGIYADSENIEHKGIETAIQFAKWLSSMTYDGSFWWKIKEVKE